MRRGLEDSFKNLTISLLSTEITDVSRWLCFSARWLSLGRPLPQKYERFFFWRSEKRKCFMTNPFCGQCDFICSGEANVARQSFQCKMCSAGFVCLFFCACLFQQYAVETRFSLSLLQRIDWLQYFNHVFSPVDKTVDDSFSLLVFDSEYFHRLGLLWEAFNTRFFLSPFHTWHMCTQHVKRRVFGNWTSKAASWIPPPFHKNASFPCFAPGVKLT